MANLLTLSDLAVWTDGDVDEVSADPKAIDVISKVSELVCFLGGHDGTKVDSAGDPIPEWTLNDDPSKAPIDVRMVVLAVCKRTYENTRQVIQEGSISVIGGDRFLDTAALLYELTEREQGIITKYNVDGDPTPDPDSGEVFVLPTTRGDETTLPQTSPLYIGDNQQINLETSADPREWKIPLFNPGDPGDDSNYSV